MPLLSICIPTFNRAHFLPETLESLACQWGEDLELTVADNASTDDTQAVVERFRPRLGAVRTYRWETNQGADRNYLQCVALATGRYALILGSDDALVPGALDRLRAELLREPALLLFNRQTCDRTLRPLRVEHFLEIGGADRRTFDLGAPGVREAYLRSGRSLCAGFSYLSSVVFEKARWDAVDTDPAFLGSAYIHTQKLLGVFCQQDARLTYLDEALVRCRLGFDSFRDQGLAHRALLDLDGYAAFARTYFEPQEPGCAEALRGLVAGEYPFGRMLRLHGVARQEPRWPEVLEKLREIYDYPAWKLGLATLLGRSRSLVELAFYMRDLRQRLGRSA